MTESRRPRHVPVGHLISRGLLCSLVLSLVVAGVVLVVLHGASELAVGWVVWGSVKNWALPW
jgi:hypothetical protein